MFENPRRQALKKFYNKCSENSRSQIVFRTDIFPKIVVGCPCIIILNELTFFTGNKIDIIVVCGRIKEEFYLLDNSVSFKDEG